VLPVSAPREEGRSKRLDDVRWGILGCGAVTEVKSGPALQRVEGSRLVAVMRRSGNLAADYARRHDVPRWYDDAERLVADPEVNAVYIATPPGSHLEHALLACAHGKPVYVEKPMARNHAECRRMLEAFRSANVPLFAAYYRRALPRFLKARELVADRALGRITGVGCRFAGPYHRNVVAGAPLPWRLRPEDSGGGLLLDLGCHTLDILDFLLGPLTAVSGTAVNVASPHDVEDNVVIQFRVAAGALGMARWNFAGSTRADEILVEGEEGELCMTTFGDEPLELRRASGVERFAIGNPAHIQEPMIASVVGDLRGVAECESTGVSAARTQAVMDAALDGYYGGRDRPFWTDPASWTGRAARARNPR
jgi:1,5-anhydro-D-fructose reductase (1,5-anhydro-D-mannitol-forming)